MNTWNSPKPWASLCLSIGTGFVSSSQGHEPCRSVQESHDPVFKNFLMVPRRPLICFPGLTCLGGSLVCLGHSCVTLGPRTRCSWIAPP